MLKLRQCDPDLLTCYGIDGSTIIDYDVEDGIWDHNTVRRLHFTTGGRQFPNSSVNNARREGAPQPCSTFDRAATGLFFFWNRDASAS